MICTGCGIYTEKDFDDPNMKLGVLCKKCREEWDQTCTPEIAIIKRKKEIPIHSFADENDVFGMLEEYRHSLGLKIEIDKDVQEVANRYISEKHYLEDNDGVEWLNGELTTDKWNLHNINVFFQTFEAYIRYNDFTDLFKRQESLEALKSNEVKFGYAENETGLILIQVGLVTPHNPYQNP